MLVVNADDAGLVEYLALNPYPRLCWFSLDRTSPRVQYQLKHQGCCVYLDHDSLLYFNGQQLQTVCFVEDIPMTLGGAARHNVSNALGAIGVAGFRFTRRRRSA